MFVVYLHSSDKTNTMWLNSISIYCILIVFATIQSKSIGSSGKLWILFTAVNLM